MHSAFGQRLGISFEQEGDRGSIWSSTPCGPTLAMTVLESSRPMAEPSAPLPSDDAYLIVALPRAIARFRVWLGSRQAFDGPVAGGSIIALDLRDNPSIFSEEAFSSLNFYVPRRALAGSVNAGQVVLGCEGGRPVQDKVVAMLGKCLAGMLECAQRPCQAFVDHIFQALLSHLVSAYGATAKPHQVQARAGLHPWQYRRVMHLIEQNYASNLSLVEMARVCNLAPSSFSRAFKVSTGKTPHKWLLQERINRSLELMRNSSTSLADVAQLVGFSDQSHFHRQFMKIMGVSPGTWRGSLAAKAA